MANRQKIIINSVKLLLFAAVLASVYEMNWMSLFVSVLTLILTYVPEILSRRYNVVLPSIFQIFVILFLFASIFLGEARSFYQKFWWWDSLLHLFSGIALGFLGFLIIYVLYKTGKFQASPILLAVLAFCFALAMGALWEIFEYLMDNFLNLNMQKSRYLCEAEAIYCNTRLGVRDTMRDLQLDAIGSFLAAITGYGYLKKKTPFFIHRLVKEFEEKNQHLFIEKE